MMKLDQRMLALFVIMMAVFILLAARSEINARDIRQNSELIEKARLDSAYKSCLGGIVILKKFNTAQQALADQERDSIKEDPDDSLGLNGRRQDRIDIYETSLVPLPDCKQLKPVR